MLQILIGRQEGVELTSRRRAAGQPARPLGRRSQISREEAESWQPCHSER